MLGQLAPAEVSQAVSRDAGMEKDTARAEGEGRFLGRQRQKDRQYIIYCIGLATLAKLPASSPVNILAVSTELQ